MNEERLRDAFKRGYRPAGPALADRVLCEVFDSRRPVEPIHRRQQWLALAAAVAVALLAVTTLMAHRYTRDHRSPALAGDVTKLRQIGMESVAAGRNDATVARYLDDEHAFTGIEAVASYSSQLEQQVPVLDAGNPDKVAIAAASAQRYAGLIHRALMAGLPAKVIVVSHDAQELSAYDHGHLFLSTPVTTGSPTLPTPIGAMKVLRKSNPWTMRSPWPAGSPNWYPDTVVQYFIWITEAGDGLHDASWQTCCYGPGSEYAAATASHGTVHVPPQAEASLYEWAEVGTPVIVYPGDGAPVAEQVAQGRR